MRPERDRGDPTRPETRRAYRNHNQARTEAPNALPSWGAEAVANLAWMSARLLSTRTTKVKVRGKVQGFEIFAG